jgi:hypothetical protein
MGITHAKVSAAADAGDTTLVRPSDWNAGHVIALVDGDIPASIARDAEVAAGYRPISYVPTHASTTGQTANDHHAQVHGAADHTDITRKLLLAAADAGLDGSVLQLWGAAPDATRIVTLANAATQGAFWQFLVPADWASGVISVQPIWIPSATDGTAHTVRWSMVAASLAAGINSGVAGTTVAWTGSSAARTQGVVVADTLTSTTLTPAAAGDLMRVNLRRVGADGADTYVGDVDLVGLVISYTASQ